jgi:hypothetical protein
MYIRKSSDNTVTMHRRPHGEVLAERPMADGLNLYREGYVDDDGCWRLTGSNRLVANP